MIIYLNKNSTMVIRNALYTTYKLTNFKRLSTISQKFNCPVNFLSNQHISQDRLEDFFEIATDLDELDGLKSTFKDIREYMIRMMEIDFQNI